MQFLNTVGESAARCADNVIGMLFQRHMRLAGQDDDGYARSRAACAALSTLGLLPLVLIASSKSPLRP